MSISAVFVVFNEENRIEDALRSAAWCDEIVVLNKSSTDRTREIALRYTSRVIDVPYSDFKTEEIQQLVDEASCEWIILETASDIIHPSLAKKIRELTDQIDFPYDIISIPFRRYILGIEEPHSPWHTKLNPLVFRKSVAVIHTDNVHGALGFRTDRYYKMPYSTNECMYHLTHATIDSMMEHHLRYCRTEAGLSSNEHSLSQSFKSIFRSLKYVLIDRRSYRLGWDGIALSLAYVSYSIINFLYLWELRMSKAPSEYELLRNEINSAWENQEAKG